MGCVLIFINNKYCLSEENPTTASLSLTKSYQLDMQFEIHFQISFYYGISLSI